MTASDMRADPDVLRATAPARAPWSTRVVAFVLDSLVLAAITWLVAPGAATPALWPGLSSPAAEGPGAGSAAVAGAVLALLVLQGWTGASVGKRAVGVVVVDASTGRPVGVLRTLLRQVLHVLDAILLIGYLRPLWDADRRTFADSIARTVVVVAPWPPSWRSVPVPVDRWARPAAVVLCVAGVVGAFPVSGGGGTTAVDRLCEVSTGVAGTSAHVRVDVYRSWETRFGVRREVPPAPAPWTVTWETGGAVAQEADVRVDVVVTGTDGTGAGRAWQSSTSNHGGPDDETYLGELASHGMPLTGAFRVDSDLVVDGATVATCTTPVRIEAADVELPAP